MGGQALKQKVRRISTKELISLRKEIKDIMMIMFKDDEQKILFPEFIAEKEDHGDIDVIVGNTYDCNSIINIKNARFPKTAEAHALEVKFGSSEVTKNHNVVSLEFKGTQTDLIYCSYHKAQSYYDYLSWNDLGNIIGRTADAMGLKYGENGLLIRISPPHSSFSHEIILSDDYDKILEFLGYGKRRSFSTYQELFEYVQDSKYFSGKLFFSQNSQNRTRNAKRKTWNKFCDILIQKGLENHSYKFDKKESADKALDFFDRRKDYESIMKAAEEEVMIKQKFNGDLVMKLTGLKGEQLGRFMESFKKDHSESILTDSSEDIEKKIFKYILNFH